MPNRQGVDSELISASASYAKAAATRAEQHNLPISAGEPNRESFPNDTALARNNKGETSHDNT
jgi:hypothetical protein